MTHVYVTSVGFGAHARPELPPLRCAIDVKQGTLTDGCTVYVA